MTPQEVVNETVDQFLASLAQKGVAVPLDTQIAARKECHSKLRYLMSEEITTDDPR